jgi:hypothetical protein
MIELYIEGQLIDLAGDDSIGIDYGLMNINDLSTRAGSRSAEFGAPKTTNNRLFFENAEDPTSLSIKPYRKLQARLFVNGVDQLVRLAILTSITDTYNIRVYDIQTDFYSIIKDRKLADLDLGQYNHYHTFANVVAGRTGNDAYVYPIIDNFVITPNATIDNVARAIAPAYLFPAVKAEFIIQKIIEEAGYSLVNEILDTPDYPADGLILPLAGDFVRDKDMGRYEGELLSVTPQGSGSVSLAYALIAYDLVSPDYLYNYWQPTAESMELGTQQFVDEVTADINVSYSVENTTASALVFYYRLDVNVTTVFTHTQIIPALSTVTITLNIPNVTVTHLTPNFGQVTTWFAANAPVNSLLINTASIVYSNVRLVQQTHPEVFYNSTLATLQSYVTIKSILPDWEQSKLIKEYCKLTCSILQVNSITKTVTIFPFDKILRNVSSAKDWSDKLDFSREPERKFSFDKYAQLNTFAYADDTTVLKPSNTDYILEIDDKTLDLEADIIKLEFAGTESVDRLNGIAIPNIKIVDENFNVNNVEPRLLVLRYKDSGDFTPTGGIVYDDSTTSSTITTDLPIPYFIDSAEPFSLGFGDNVFTNFYSALAGILENAKIITVPLRLNEADINQLDLMKPVYISHFNAYFYINSINNYQPGANESTEVELVKLF